MRKALIAIAVATALFAVGAFAASFAVQSEDIASGSNPTDPCATNADVDFTETFDTATNNWNVASIKVTFSGGTPTRCVGANSTLILQNQTDVVVFQEEKLVPAPGAAQPVSVTYTPSGTSVTHALPLTVAEVWNSAVLIDDLNIPTV